MKSVKMDCASKSPFTADHDTRKKAPARIENFVSYKWNVAEIFPHMHFETYVLEDWGNAFTGEKIRDAWAGYCFGMRDHFSILHNEDVTRCCVDFDGKTAVRNLRHSSLKEILMRLPCRTLPQNGPRAVWKAVTRNGRPVLLESSLLHSFRPPVSWSYL